MADPVLIDELDYDLQCQRQTMMEERLRPARKAQLMEFFVTSDSLFFDVLANALSDKKRLDKIRTALQVPWDFQSVGEELWVGMKSELSDEVEYALDNYAAFCHTHGLDLIEEM